MSLSVNPVLASSVDSLDHAGNWTQAELEKAFVNDKTGMLHFHDTLSLCVKS